MNLLEVEGLCVVVCSAHAAGGTATAAGARIVRGRGGQTHGQKESPGQGTGGGGGWGLLR